jgi:hypothetical protein
VSKSPLDRDISGSSGGSGRRCPHHNQDSVDGSGGDQDASRGWGGGNSGASGGLGATGLALRPRTGGMGRSSRSD